MSIKHTLLTFALLAVLLAHGQFPHMDRAKLLATHFGGKPVGNPPRITWVPQGEDAKHFDHLPSKHVVTTVDTLLAKGEDEILVFFRTSAFDVGEEGEGLMPDQLGLARYTYSPSNKTPDGWAPVRFEKWFAEQGTNGMPPKPRRVGDEGSSLFMVTSEVGDMMQSIRTERYFSLPDLKEVLTVNTSEFEETRGGPNGPEMSMTDRAVKVIVDPANRKEFPDIEVIGGEGTDGAVVRYAWNGQLRKYVETRSAPKTVSKPGTGRPPGKPVIRK